MTAVAGDYDHIRVKDARHAGILVADVTGHGVPAALVASMIKVAMTIGRELRRGPGRGAHEAQPSALRGAPRAVCHAADCGSTPTCGVRAIPPQGILRCLHWSHASGEVRPFRARLLFGVSPDTTYPVDDLLLGVGDHLPLYTDGLIEPEKPVASCLATHRLEEVAREHQAGPGPAISSNRLLDELWAGRRSGLRRKMTSRWS